MTSEAIGYLALVLAALGILAGILVQWRRDQARRTRAAQLAARLDYVIRDPRSTPRV